jgi:hypothetical protein
MNNHAEKASTYVTALDALKNGDRLRTLNSRSRTATMPS